MHLDHAFLRPRVDADVGGAEACVGPCTATLEPIEEDEKEEESKEEEDMVEGSSIEDLAPKQALAEVEEDDTALT